MSKVIIAGSRDIKDYDLICQVIKDSNFKITEVVSGCAQGVDSLGERWAKDNNVPIKQFKADWKDLKAKDAVVRENKFGKYNSRAGLDRNITMGKYADLLIAIGDTSGTMHMISTMKKLEKEIYHHSLEEKYAF